MPKQRLTLEQLLLAKRIDESLAYAKSQYNKSKAKVAKECGVTAQALNNWLRRGKISKHSLSLLAQATNVNLVWLYSGQGTKEVTAGNQVREDSSNIYQAPTLDNIRLAQSVEHVLKHFSQQAVKDLNHHLVAEYITAKYLNLISDQDIISTLAELQKK